MEHEQYMQRCLQLAQNGLGSTSPNPMVGCVIVHNGQIIGEGWHRKAGEPHAEVRAIASVKNSNLLPKSTLYVNLEPCNHFGKTPPCTDLILTNNIKNIVIGTQDPFSEVSGKGIERLKKAGCNVLVGVLEKESQELNKRFFTFHNQKRPYIILKWAETHNGFIAPLHKIDNRPVWISGKLSQQLVHKWRSEEQAILVGKNTVLCDNSSLTTRLWAGKNPLRLVIDPKKEIPSNFSVYDANSHTVIFSSKENNSTKTVYFQKISYKKNILEQICNFLFERNLQSVIVEGGAFTLQQFIDANLWDEARVFVGKTLFTEGIKSPKIAIPFQKKEKIGEDDLFWYKNKKL